MCHLLLWCAFSAVAAAGAVHSSDSGAVTEDIPYGKRISDALTGFIIGWILLVFCMLLVFVVEKQAVKFDLILSRCRKSTRVLSGAVVDPDNEEGTVFLKGITSVGSGTSPLHDNHTGFHYKGQRNPIRLRRQVMMYQWVEHETKEEKKSVYSYRMEWSEADHDSSRFKNPAGHRNPPRHPPLYSETRDAAAVRLGQFTLSPELVAKMNKWEICDIPQGDGSGFSDGGLVECEMKYHMDTSHVNYGNLLNTSKRDLSDFLVYNGQLRSPRVGTVKVCYEAVLELGAASILGVQTRDTLRAFTYADAQDMQPPCLRRITNALTCQGGHQEYDVQDYRVGEEDSGGCCGGVCCMCAPIAQALAGGVVGTEVLLLEERHTTPVQLFRDEHSKFGKRLNLMRAAGCLGISIGIFLIFNPISVVLSFIPYLSGLISHLFFALALIIGFVIGAAEISLAWVFHRPHYMLVVLLGVGGYFSFFGQVVTGGVLLALSLIPLTLCIAHCCDDCIFDKSMAERRRNRVAMATAETVTSYQSFEDRIGVDIETGTATAPPADHPVFASDGAVSYPCYDNKQGNKQPNQCGTSESNKLLV